MATDPEGEEAVDYSRAVGFSLRPPADSNVYYDIQNSVVLGTREALEAENLRELSVSGMRHSVKAPPEGGNSLYIGELRVSNAPLPARTEARYSGLYGSAVLTPAEIPLPEASSLRPSRPEQRDERKVSKRKAAKQSRRKNRS